MPKDMYNRPIESFWILGHQLKDLREMIMIAIRLFDEEFTGTEVVFDVNGRFNVLATSTLYKAKGVRQPKDLRGVKLMNREKGYFVSIVEPNPAKAKFIQVYAKIWMRKSGEGFWQEVLHCIYKPEKKQLFQLMYLPDCSQGADSN